MPLKVVAKKGRGRRRIRRKLGKKRKIKKMKKIPKKEIKNKKMPKIKLKKPKKKKIKKMVDLIKKLETSKLDKIQANFEKKIRKKKKKKPSQMNRALIRAKIQERMLLNKRNENFLTTEFRQQIRVYKTNVVK